MAWTLSARRLLTPFDVIDHPRVVVDGGTISKIGSAADVEAIGPVLDLGDAAIAPGFVDIHIHGGGGHDVMEDDSAALPAVEMLIAQHGVTGYFPTTVTAPLDQTLRALERLGKAIESAEKDGDPARARRAWPLGIHLRDLLSVMLGGACIHRQTCFHRGSRHLKNSGKRHAERSK